MESILVAFAILLILMISINILGGSAFYVKTPLVPSASFENFASDAQMFREQLDMNRSINAQFTSPLIDFDSPFSQTLETQETHSQTYLPKYHYKPAMRDFEFDNSRDFENSGEFENSRDFENSGEFENSRDFENSGDDNSGEENSDFDSMNAPAPFESYKEISLDDEVSFEDDWAPLERKHVWTHQPEQLLMSHYST